MTSIRPFEIDIPRAVIRDLHKRLDLTRWPEQELVSDWTQGIPLAYVQDVCDYWRHNYDWRDTEEELNSYQNYLTTIDNLDIHFLHVESSRSDARPLLITHG